MFSLITLQKNHLFNNKNHQNGSSRFVKYSQYVSVESPAEAGVVSLPLHFSKL